MAYHALLAHLVRVVCQADWLAAPTLVMVLFAWQDDQRSLVKLAQVVRDTAGTMGEALAGDHSLGSVLSLIQCRMSVEQAQEASQCGPTLPARLDELGAQSLYYEKAH